jgi:hypothetical protein
MSNTTVFFVFIFCGLYIIAEIFNFFLVRIPEFRMLHMAIENALRGVDYEEDWTGKDYNKWCKSIEQGVWYYPKHLKNLKETRGY